MNCNRFYCRQRRQLIRSSTDVPSLKCFIKFLPLPSTTARNFGYHNRPAIIPSWQSNLKSWDIWKLFDHKTSLILLYNLKGPSCWEKWGECVYPLFSIEDDHNRSPYDITNGKSWKAYKSVNQYEVLSGCRCHTTWESQFKRLKTHIYWDIYIYVLYLCHRPVAFFLLFWKKHGFEVKRREKLPSNTFPIFSAWRKITKTKRRKLALKRRKMALKQHKILGTIRNTYFFSETTCFLPNGKNYCRFGKRHFFCEPGWYRYSQFDCLLVN